MDRREAIAAAAVELVAEGGSHALTHRRIDRRLGLPEGTTSNYARSRRDLVKMVIDRVARSRVSVASPTLSRRPCLRRSGSWSRRSRSRRREGTDTRARMALSIDCLQDAELHELLTTRSPVRVKLLGEAEAMHAALGVPRPDRRAIDFIGVMKGLLYDRLIGNGVRGVQVDAAEVLEAWLIGVGARQ